MCLYVYVHVMCVYGCLWGVAGVFVGVSVGVAGVFVGVYGCGGCVWVCTGRCVSVWWLCTRVVSSVWCICRHWSEKDVWRSPLTLPYSFETESPAELS